MNLELAGKVFIVTGGTDGRDLSQGGPADAADLQRPSPRPRDARQELRRRAWPRGIRVNALLPNLFATDRIKHILGDKEPPVAGIALKR